MSEPKFSTLSGIQDALAEAVCKQGERTLQCLTCGKEKSANKDQVAKYLGTAWPKCHDRTMELL